MNYLPLLASRAAPMPADDLAKLEQLVGAPIPESYVEFLSQSNGGSFEADIVALAALGDETVLNYMFSTVNADYNIFQDYKNLRAMDRIPVQTLPFADDPGGNLFLLSVEPDSYGSVFFWDHEREPEDGGSTIADFPNMSRVADDFAGFIRSLKDDPA